MSQGKGILRTIADFINPYGWITKVRNKAFDSNLLESRSFGTPTICIGNISVGGTGKTPHTEYLIRLLKEKERVAVLSRGYGRKSKGYIKATADTPMPIIGDEPFQIKQKFPDITVAVCEKRVVGAENLLKEPEKPKSMARPTRERRPRRQAAPASEAKAEEVEVAEEVKKEDAE